ncbi:hypothetical protein YC2023_022935 [Brassica napus]
MSGDAPLPIIDSALLNSLYRYDKIDLSRISVQPIINTSSRFASVFVQYLFVRCSETGLAGEVRVSVHHNGPLPQLDLLPFFTNKNQISSIYSKEWDTIELEKNGSDRGKN